MTAPQHSIYEDLDTETQIVVREKADEIHLLIRRTTDVVVMIGKKLMEVKATLGHGQFGAWLREEFGWSDQTALNFMNVARGADQNPKILEFDPSIAYMLTAPSTPAEAVVSVIAAARRGVPISVASVKRTIASHTVPGKQASSSPSPTAPAIMYSPNETIPPDSPHTPWPAWKRVLCTGCLAAGKPQAEAAHADWVVAKGSRATCNKCGAVRNLDSMDEWQPPRSPPRPSTPRRTPAERLAARPAAPGTYRVILVDPPWTFTLYDEDLGQVRTAESHYPTIGLDDLAALPVASLAAPDCALFLWVTWPNLFNAGHLIAAWGFTYKTCAFAWAKLNPGAVERLGQAADDANWHIGMGCWSRANTEVCLLATKGAPPRLNADVRQLIVDPIREHSRKPDQQYARIERLLTGPYCELFARQKREGWAAWGNEIEADFAFGWEAAAQ